MILIVSRNLHLHLHSAFSTKRTSQLMPLIHPFTAHTHTNGERLPCKATTRSWEGNWGLGVLLRDTLTHPGRGIEMKTLQLPDNCSYSISGANVAHRKKGAKAGLLASLPAYAIQPLQLIQNAASRLIFNLPRFSHVTPLLQSHHWLPVAARIRFKVLTLDYAAANKMAPPYQHHSGLHASSTTPLCCHRPTCSSSQPREWLSLHPSSQFM